MEKGIKQKFMEEIKGIRFGSIDEIYERKDEIRKRYQELEKENKEIYKWYYFYQLSLIKRVELKRLLWYYINNSEEENKEIRIELSNEYKKLKEDRIRMKEKRERYRIAQNEKKC